MVNGTVLSVGNRPSRRRIRIDVRAARCGDILRSSLAATLRRTDHYVVHRNVRVPLTLQAKQQVRKAKGRYLGTALPCTEPVVGHSMLDLLVVDKSNRWAGGYAVCWGNSHSTRARRRIARDLRAVELVLRAYMARSAGEQIETVTIGLIDGVADSANSDDVTIALDEISDHFDLQQKLAVNGVVPIGADNE